MRLVQTASDNQRWHNSQPDVVVDDAAANDELVVLVLSEEDRSSDTTAAGGAGLRFVLLLDMAELRLLDCDKGKDQRWLLGCCLFVRATILSCRRDAVDFVVEALLEEADDG